MSILRELRRWIDSNEFREEQADHKAWRELRLQGEPEGGPDPEAQLGVCRICRAEVRGQAWCPSCLAFTVERPRR